MYVNIKQPFLNVQFTAFSTFTLFCNHHHHPFPDLSHLPKLESIPIKHPSFLTPPAPGTHPPAFSMNLTTLGTSYEWNHTVFVFCDWLISLSKASSRLIHVAAYVSTFFFFKAESYSIAWVDHLFSIH